MRLVVGMSGASGAIYGIRLLEVCQALPGGRDAPRHEPRRPPDHRLETDWDPAKVDGLADVVHRFGDIAAAPSSGSFRLDAMVVVPCSMKTLAGIAYSLSDNLLVRAADVALKERRPLVVAPRETPLHLGHLRTMVQLAEMGAILAPPMPAFYHRPVTIEEIVNQTVGRMLDLLGIEPAEELFQRWRGGPGDSPEPGS